LGRAGSRRRRAVRLLHLRRERGIGSKGDDCQRYWLKTRLRADSSNYGGFFCKTSDGRSKPWNPCVFYY
jgi:hypothetical protein